MSTRGKGGCGCGGGGGGSGGGAAGATSAGCGCGGACGCGTKGGAACTPGAIERPQFFGGQLLTEDDLQDLVDYVVAKNRLHNRALFGDGVVCGLEVTCDPCGGAKIVVRPGYALDCCGNDIPVDCSVTLDVNQMIRDLRQQRLGQDCGDPCKQDATDGSAATPDPGLDPGEIIGLAGAPTAVAEAPPPLYMWLGRGCKDLEPVMKSARCEAYCLYIRYCETQTEPVAPYATDDCSPSSCQPTRTREGYRFELRCRTKADPPRTIEDRIEDCERDLMANADMSERAELMYRTFAAVTVGARRAIDGEAIEFSAQDREALGTAQEALRARLELKRAPAGGDLVEGLHGLIEVGALMARAHLAAGAAGEGKELDKAEARAQKQAAARVLKEITKGPLLLDGAAYYKTHLEKIEDPFARVLAEEAASYFAGPLDERLESDPVQGRILAEGGGFVTERVLEAALAPAAELRRLLVSHVSRGGQTDCRMRDAVMSLPTFRLEEKRTFGFAGKGLDPGSVLASSKGIAGVSQLYKGARVACECEAFNPPCAPCDDQAVLLACLTWEDCKVVDICNLVRKWVITGPNLRYWAPPLGEIGEYLERMCCPDPCDANDAVIDVSGAHQRLRSLFAQRLADPNDDVRARLAVVEAKLARMK